MTWILNIYQSFGILKNKQYYAMNKSLFYKEFDDVNILYKKLRSF